MLILEKLSTYYFYINLISSLCQGDSCVPLSCGIKDSDWQSNTSAGNNVFVLIGITE